MKGLSFLNQQNEYYDVGIVNIESYCEFHNIPPQYEWVKSIFVFSFGYQQPRIKTSQYISSKFAYGDDYHQVLTRFLEDLLSREEIFKRSRYEIKVDVNPFNEKTLAYLAGLGVFGKNNLIISPRFGTYHYLATILTDLKFSEYSKPLEIDLCGQCDFCIKACPTKALNQVFVREKCLSYLTQYPSINYELYNKIRNVFVGCDICQEICPYNKKEYSILPELYFNDLSLVNLENLEKNDIKNFKKYYAKKTFKWIGLVKMIRNILVLETNNKNISIEKLNYYQNKFKNIDWFVKHIEYLKEKMEKCQ